MVSRADIPRIDRSVPVRDRGVTREKALAADGLRVDEMTLRERQDYNTWILNQRRLDRDEAELMSYRQEEIDLFFGKPIEVSATSPIQSILAVEPQMRSGFDRIVPSTLPTTTGFDRVKARTMGFTGDCCTLCGGARMTRNGSCLACVDCGNTTGCT